MTTSEGDVPGPKDGASLTPSGTAIASPLLLPSTDQTPGEWDRIVRVAGGGLLQSWQWGEFKRQAGWEPVRLSLNRLGDVVGESASQTVTAAQVLFRAVPHLALPVSIAYVPRGPLDLTGALSSSPAGDVFWRDVHQEARRRGAIFLKVEPDIRLSDERRKEEVDRTMAGLGFRPSGRLQPARTIVLDLHKSEEDLLKAMKPKTRYNLRLSERRGVRVRRAESIGDLREFYSLLEVTGNRDEFGIHSLRYYEHLWKLFGPSGANSMLLLLADDPDDAERAAGPIAGLVVLQFGHEAIYMYGASADRGREHMPNYLLQWEAVRWARGQGCDVYDFWGIPDPPDEEPGPNEAVSPTNTRSGLRGVYWFKKGFGGKEVEYPGAYDYVYNPLLYRLWMRWRGSDLG
ncbi:MAG TPA: peptidoglycan bridge formation glycyltransferase FemA/FemB family protein [Chloroflexota bacterium]|nr:peptidoglycan bridge formation glycyltransferase FemA/FemB family protein [Chloroflexota bacterium]